MGCCTRSSCWVSHRSAPTHAWRFVHLESPSGTRLQRWQAPSRRSPASLSCAEGWWCHRPVGRLSTSALAHNACDAGARARSCPMKARKKTHTMQMHERVPTQRRRGRAHQHDADARARSCPMTARKSTPTRCRCTSALLASVSPAIAITSDIFAVIIVPLSCLGRKVSLES